MYLERERGREREAGEMGLIAEWREKPLSKARNKAMPYFLSVQTHQDLNSIGLE